MSASAAIGRPQTIDATRLGELATWREFAPHFHIADSGLFAKTSFFALGERETSAARDQVRSEGYYQAYGLDWGLDIARMAQTIRALTAAGISPAFAFVYDEFWLPFLKIAPILKSLLGSFAILPDFWAWNVEPHRGDAGWAPHRDRGAVSLLPDGSPKSLTVWIPLTPATPLSSCMYVVPAKWDPTYGTKDEGRYAFDHQSIRVLPAMPGDFIVWNQALLHWGSRASALAPESRVSVAMQFQRTDQPPMREPLLNPLALIPFEARLNLIAAQILGYQNLYKHHPAVESFANARIGHLVQ